VLDERPEDPDDVYKGYALYCTNKDMYLRCIDNTNYEWIDTLEDDRDFLLDVDGESKPFGDYYRGIKGFIESLHCVLVPCKLYKKNYVDRGIVSNLLGKGKTYRGRFTEPTFTKSIDFDIYFERRLEEEEITPVTTTVPSSMSSTSSTVSSSIAFGSSSIKSSQSVPNKPTKKPPPSPPPPKGRVLGF